MDLENILWTLLPLIMLIIISWILSYMGSKVAKKRQEEELMKGETPGERSEGEFFETEGDELFEPSRIEGTAEPGYTERRRLVQWDKAKDFQPAPPTPEPIKPKWWGA